MPKLNFGQPDDGIMQMAYVVKDIHQAMEEWVARLKVGPWFVLDHFTGEHPVYRGGPSRADMTLAMSFAGHMNIELIQTNDDHPSVYKELIDSRGYGFHHWGLASADVDADVKRYEAMGMEVAFRAGVPTGGDVAYMDTHGTGLRGTHTDQPAHGAGLLRLLPRHLELGRQGSHPPVHVMPGASHWWRRDAIRLRSDASIQPDFDFRS